jgi:hypothetical protein
MTASDQMETCDFELTPTLPAAQQSASTGCARVPVADRALLAQISSPPRVDSRKRP